MTRRRETPVAWRIRALIAALAVLLAILTGSLCLRVQAYQQRTAGTATAALPAEAGFYQKLNAAATVRLLVVGDSIAEPMDPTGWAPRLRERLRREYGSQAEIVNVSLGGNVSYAGYVRTMLRPETQFDLAIVCFGQNDAEADFPLQYEALLRTIRRRYPDCAMICVLESSQRTYTPKMQTLQRLAAHYGAPVADTIEAFSQSGVPYEALCRDGVHPNALGNGLYLEALMGVIRTQAAQNAPLPGALPEPLDPAVTAWDSWYWLDAADFTRADALTFVHRGTALRGDVGLDIDYRSGENRVTLWLDGEQAAELNVRFRYDFSQRRIVPLAQDCRVQQEIRVVFGSLEQADSFRGMMWTGIE